MPDWKQHLLAAYYYGTLPYRRWWNDRAARAGRAPVIVLFYHRVADEYPNAWTVSNAVFAQQIEWLRARFEMISLEEAQRRIRHGGCSEPAVSITFDDGYAENCEQALPLLVEHGIPCTYFVCTQHVVRGLPFPHDLARGRPLPMNSIEQLRALAKAGIQIGAHGRTHADLGGIHDIMRLRDEVVHAGHELETAVGHPVRYFAFPYGMPENLNLDAFQLAREAGYQAVCSAYGGYNFPGDDPFHLQRIHADPEMIRLMNWVTVDPRKRSAAKRYLYEPQTAAACQPIGVATP